MKVKKIVDGVETEVEVPDTKLGALKSRLVSAGDYVSGMLKIHPAWGVALVLICLYSGIAGAGRVTGLSNGVPVLLGKDMTQPKASQAIYMTRDGEPMVWIDGEGDLHGHLQQRSNWFKRFFAGDFYASPLTVNMNKEQIEKRLLAEAEAMKAASEKLAAKAQKIANTK